MFLTFNEQADIKCFSERKWRYLQKSATSRMHVLKKLISTNLAWISFRWNLNKISQDIKFCESKVKSFHSVHKHFSSNVWFFQRPKKSELWHPHEFYSSIMWIHFSNADTNFIENSSKTPNQKLFPLWCCILSDYMTSATSIGFSFRTFHVWSQLYTKRLPEFDSRSLCAAEGFTTCLEIWVSGMLLFSGRNGKFGKS